MMLYLEDAYYPVQCPIEVPLFKNDSFKSKEGKNNKKTMSKSLYAPRSSLKYLLPFHGSKVAWADP